MSTRVQTPLTLSATIAGRYVIERELGRGGMAIVYLARDMTTDRRVAVKVLLPDLAASIGADRFLREIELGKVLQHERIVGVLDSGEAAGQLYYTMPFVEGESLRDRLDRVKQLTIDETLAITRQVAEALDHAHSKHVVHRDIKPENIMLSGDDAFVMDFGIAHAVTSAGGEKLTKTGMAVGTPAYMSPEQAVGAKDVTAQSDIYSLGCVVYEMLAGEPPFAGANAMALLAKHSLESVPSIRVVRQSVPPQLEDAIFCALEKTPVDRFKSAGDFSRALAGEIPVPKHTRTRTGAGAAARQRSRRAMIIGAAAAVLVLGGGGFAAWKMMSRGAVASRIGGESDPTHIAVLYFEDGSQKKDLAFLADGLTEALIRELSGVKQLRVISRNGVTPFRGKLDVAPDSVGRALKVGTVVTGKVSQSGDKLRIDVSLVDALDNEELDNVRLEQPRDSVVALQDELAKQVSDVLRRKLGEGIEALSTRVGTRNAKAWEALQRARQTIAAADEMNRVQKNKAAASRQLVEADRELAAVEKMDDKWTEPTVQRAWVAYEQARLNVDPEKLASWIQAGIGHAERALARAATNPDALEARGALRYWGVIQGIEADPAKSAQLLKGAEEDLKASTKANPTQAGAWNTLSHLLLRRQRPAEGKQAADRAYEADPYLTNVHLTIWRRFQASLDLGNRTEAMRACDLGQSRFPEDFRFTECRLWLHAMKSPTKPAPAQVWADYEEFVKRSPDNLREFLSYKGKMMVALGLARAGLPDSARSLAVSTQRAAPADPENELLYLLAIVHAQIPTQRDTDEAIRILGRFLAGSPQRAEDEGGDDSWWIENIRGDPKYKALVGQ